MHRFVLILALLLFGCNRSSDATQPPTRPGVSKPPATQTVLKPIELRYGIYLARLDHRIMVSPDGTLRSVRTENKSYGGNDIDPKHERIEVREGRLTADQMTDLARLFADWDSLSSKPYAGVPDGGDVSIRYGNETVSGGSGVPTAVAEIRDRLSELARSMPVVKS